MTVEIASFVFGVLLIFIGIVGGGFEVKDLKVPQIKGLTRLLCAVGGVVFILLGLGLKSGDLTRSDHTQLQLLSRESSGLVYFTIRDELGEGQVSERVRVLINGKEVGTLTVNEYYPTSTVTVAVPDDGPYSYVLEATAVFKDDNQLREIVGMGQGLISVKNGNVYDLASSISGDTWLAHMEEVSR